MKNITIIGIGMGNVETLTIDACNKIKKAEFFIGAERMVKSALDICENEVGYEHAITAGDIEDAIEKSKANNIAVLMSGDTGFFSGTKKLIPLLIEKEYAVEVLPGISSMQYFFSKIQKSWNDAYIGSIHGRDENPMGKILTNKKAFFLLGPEKGADYVCRMLVDMGLGDLPVYVGERLSYEDEKITEGTASSLCNKKFDGLSVMLVENRKATDYDKAGQGIRDDVFIRGKVPMSKEEVRAVSIGKLDMPKSGIIYDVGAGTGSVSCEMALTSPESIVYAIETKKEAVDLIEENKAHLNIQNLVVIEGMAPEILALLPAPDAVFIGGSKGNMKEIISAIFAKNPEARIVVNAIALETVAETLNIIKELKPSQVDICQVATSQSKKVGPYNMMTAQNPIYIISMGGKVEYDEQ